MTKQPPDFSFEMAASQRGFTCIAGVDEVGRGPLAGPVTAAAVRLNPAQIPEGLNDSKALTATRRDVLFDQIMAQAEVCIAHATVEEIDTLNILRASHLAMERAIAGLPNRAGLCVDRRKPDSARYDLQRRGDCQGRCAAACRLQRHLLWQK